MLLKNFGAGAELLYRATDEINQKKHTYCLIHDKLLEWSYLSTGYYKSKKKSVVRLLTWSPSKGLTIFIIKRTR